MANETIPMTYLLAGLLIPGTVMIGARYFGMAASTASAQASATALPKLDALPNHSLSIAVDSDSTESQSIVARSPFWWDDIEATLFEDPFQTSHDPEPIKRQVFHEILVTSILPHPQNPLAIINSKPCRIGDDLGNGWKLAEINGKTRTVILLHTSGKHQTISLSSNP